MNVMGNSPNSVPGDDAQPDFAVAGEDTDQDAHATSAGDTNPGDTGPEADAADPSAAHVALDEFEEAKQRWLRAEAELENVRKRMRREMEENRKFASLPLFRDVLPVMDNLQRAISSAEQNESSTGLLDGVKMVAQQLATVLEQHNCRPIRAEGETFDPNRHEAIAQAPSDQHPAGTVMQVVQAGYQLHDRVVRPSQVMVSQGAASSSGESST